MSARSKSNSGGRQSTLLGIWKGSKNGNKDEQGERSGSGGVKRNHANLSQPASRVAPPLRLDGGRTRLENVSLPNGPMLLLRGCVGGKKASERTSTRRALESLPQWNDNVTFKIYGKECKMRRSICQFSTGGKISYSYSGLRNVVAPEFPAALFAIKRQVENLICEYILEVTEEAASSTPTKNLSSHPGFVEMLKAVKNSKDGSNTEIFNYCLCNWYKSGEEYMGYHADDEADLDPISPIASVSLGTTRSFDIRPRKKDANNKRSRVSRITLGDGDMLLMFPPMQSHYEHAVPVEKRVAGGRINLTFRRIVTREKK